jgi:hypothetical protein
VLKDGQQMRITRPPGGGVATARGSLAVRFVAGDHRLPALRLRDAA